MRTRIRRIRSRRRLRRLLQLRRFRRDERGIQLVELAIVIPIFLILFAATAEFGRYFYEYTTLAKAARAGARYLSVNPVTAANDLEGQKIVVYGNIDGTGSAVLPGLALTHVDISRTGGSAVVPETVTVKIVGYPHQPIFNLGGLTKTTGLSMSVDVKPSVTMRFLGQPPPIE